jgi:hypothetical protein
MSLRLEPSAAVREKRLLLLLGERGLDRSDAGLARIVEDAMLVGSLGLAGIQVSWEEAQAPGGGPAQLVSLRRARAAVPLQAALTVEALRQWHAAIAGSTAFRAKDEPARRDAPPSSPSAFVADRLAGLVEWLEAPGASELGPEQKAAVALARIVEIRPFDDANGRVSRLAAAHLLERAGLGPPILVAGDASRLQATLEAAFRLETGPLVELVREASGRALDVMIQSLERRLV